jgi:hypothetical protein
MTGHRAATWIGNRWFAENPGRLAKNIDSPAGGKLDAKVKRAGAQAPPTWDKLAQSSAKDASGPASIFN